MRLQAVLEQFIPYLEPQDASSCRKEERRRHRHTTTRVSPSRWRSPLQGLEAPTFDFSDNSFDNNYTSR